MTIYRLYVQNGNRAGFWIQHRSWQNMCAQVLSIAGRRTGQLPGHAPNHDNAAVIVRCFDVRSGRDLPPSASIDSADDAGYVAIAQPSWSRGSEINILVP